MPVPDSSSSYSSSRRYSREDTTYSSAYSRSGSSSSTSGLGGRSSYLNSTYSSSSKVTSALPPRPPIYGEYRDRKYSSANVGRSYLTSSSTSRIRDYGSSSSSSSSSPSGYRSSVSPVRTVSAATAAYRRQVAEASPSIMDRIKAMDLGDRDAGPTSSYGLRSRSLRSDSILSGGSASSSLSASTRASLFLDDIKGEKDSNGNPILSSSNNHYPKNNDFSSSFGPDSSTCSKIPQVSAEFKVSLPKLKSVSSSSESVHNDPSGGNSSEEDGDDNLVKSTMMDAGQKGRKSKTPTPTTNNTKTSPSRQDKTDASNNTNGVGGGHHVVDNINHAATASASEGALMGPHSSRHAYSSSVNRFGGGGTSVAVASASTNNKASGSNNISDSDNDSDALSPATHYVGTGKFRNRENFEKAGLTGLRNIGNTCFMNTVLQCLSNSRPLLEYVMRDNYETDINRSTSGMKGALMRAFGDLIHELWREQRVVDTSAFKDAIQRFAPRFMGYNQQDAQEFLRYLLEGLHEDVNRITARPTPITTDIDESMSDNEKASESWRRYLRYESSKIVDMFVGQFKSTLRCTVCGHCSVTFDPFWDLSLPIPSRATSVKLAQCFELLTKEEVLDGDEKPTCAKCQRRQKCTKSLAIQKWPKILVIHLKRFSLAERYRGKLSTLVDYPLTGLDLTQFAATRGNVSAYNLYGVANHSGSTYSGHYIAYCKHPYSGEWHCYNDSRVSPITPHTVISTDGYVLFYEQGGPSTSSL